MARKPTKNSEEQPQLCTPEYKPEGVRLSDEGTKLITAGAADLGIAASQLHRWRRQHADHSLAAFPGNGKTSSHE